MVGWVSGRCNRSVGELGVSSVYFFTERSRSASEVVIFR
jgi:hypothetical protein